MKKEKTKSERAAMVEGMKAAAAVAASYNSVTRHAYRLDDCILAKLNVTKRKPRKNRAILGPLRDEWMCGYAAALGSVAQLDGRSLAKQVLVGDGLTMKNLVVGKAEKFDLERIREPVRR